VNEYLPKGRSHDDYLRFGIGKFQDRALLVAAAGRVESPLDYATVENELRAGNSSERDLADYISEVFGAR